MENNVQRQLITTFLFFLDFLLQIAPIHSGMFSSPGASVYPITQQEKVRTLLIVRHLELIALYASALNHVLGQ